jgi:hypothetical protein
MAFKGVGLAVARGVPYTFAWAHTVGTTDATVSDVNNKPMSFQYTEDANTTDHRDGNSAVFAVSADEPVHSITIRTQVVATSGANTAAQARLHAIPPDLLSYVTLAAGPAYYNGTWLYKGGASFENIPDGATEMTMTLFRHGFDVETPTTFAAGTF